MAWIGDAVLGVGGEGPVQMDFMMFDIDAIEDMEDTVEELMNLTMPC